MCDSALSFWVGLGVADQVVFLATLVLWNLSGAVVASHLPKAPQRRTVLLALCAAFGMSLHMALCFLFFHHSFYSSLGIGIDGAARVAWAALFVVAGFGVRPFLRAWRDGERGDEGIATGLFFVSSLVSACVAFGFGNSALPIQPGNWIPAPPEWGAAFDRQAHLRAFVEVLHAYGFPGRELRNYGVQLNLMGMSLLATDAEPMERAVAYSKPACIVWFFLATYGLFAVARHVLGSSSNSAALAASILPFYAAINPSWIFPPPGSNHFVYPASASLYHNVTQLAGTAVGFPALLLILVDFAQPGRTFLAGCFLLAASFSYKQALFMIALPAILLGLVSARRREAFTHAAVSGLAVLGFTAAFYFAYPALAGIEVRRLPLGIDFFWHFRAGPDAPHFYPPSPALAFLPDSTAVRVAALVVFGYAAWIVPLAALWLRKGRDRPHEKGAHPPDRPRRPPFSPATVVLLAMFVFGTTAALVLVENDEQLWHTWEFQWAFAVAQFCLLPFLTRLLAAIQSPPWRMLAYSILGLHLASGLGNLYLYVTQGVTM